MIGEAESIAVIKFFIKSKYALFPNAHFNFTAPYFLRKTFVVFFSLECKPKEFSNIYSLELTFPEGRNFFFLA